MILLARDVGREQPRLGLLDAHVRRNAFGRQVDSFETALAMPVLGEPPFPAVFIRAPLIEAVGDGIEVLATLTDGTIVAARQGNLLATAFHPELTGDPRLHAYFLGLGRHGETAQ
jgi:5'-phosphate synthase pdxT subunit